MRLYIYTQFLVSKKRQIVENQIFNQGSLSDYFKKATEIHLNISMMYF